MRNTINSDLDLSVESRIENIRRSAEISKMFLDNGTSTINCFISPVEASREQAKKIIGDENWFFTSRGVYTYTQKENVFEKIQIVPNTDFKYSFINNTGISTALLDPKKDRLWLCTTDKGVYTKESGKPLKPFLIEPNESQSINNVVVKKILLDNVGNLWFTSNRGLFCKSKNEISPKSLAPPCDAIVIN